MSRRRNLFWIVLSCLVTGAFPGFVGLVFSGSFAGFLADALNGFVYASCIAIPCWLTIPWVLQRLEGRSFALRAAATLGLLGFFASLGCLAGNLILSSLGLVPPGQWERFFWISLRICLIITFSVGLISLVVATLQDRLADARLAEERARKLAAEARFASLESRVRPHFLFNTLNSISALVREDPAEAERTIERLAALLRFSLDNEVQGVVTLAEELRIVRDYLEIERVRFCERLRFRFEIQPEAESQMVPALSVQTLVENSVKYAVGPSAAGAEIVVSAEVRDGRLRVEVSDDGPGFGTGLKAMPGHGIDLLTRRLAAQFGPAARLELSADGGRTRVVMAT